MLSILAVVGMGLVRQHPVAIVDVGLGPVHASEALGAVPVLKAFAAGCSALTGVEGHRQWCPGVPRSCGQPGTRTEVALGVLLIGLAVLIKVHHTQPRGGVTILAQLSAAFGVGWLFYLSNLSVTVVLLFAANTSFGGLPVLMGLLAKITGYRTCAGCAPSGPCFVTASAHWRCWPRCCWWSSEPTPTGLLPLFAIGVFIGFTISQVGWSGTGGCSDHRAGPGGPR